MENFDFRPLKEEIETFKNYTFLIEKHLQKFNDFSVKQSGKKARKYLNELRKQSLRLRKNILFMLKDMGKM